MGRQSYRGNGGVRAAFSACKINSMASKWQSKLARVSRMDWEEVRVRAGQEFHKHSDLLMHRMGVRAGRDSAEAIRRRGRDNSFFPPGKFRSARSCCANTYPTKWPKFCATLMRFAAIVFACWATKVLSSLSTAVAAISAVTISG